MGEVISRFRPKGESEPERRNFWKILLLILAFTFDLRLFLGLFPEVIHNDRTEYRIRKR
jgi:hypothetical protein